MGHGVHGDESGAALGSGTAAGPLRHPELRTTDGPAPHTHHQTFSTVLRGAKSFMHGIGADPLALGVHAWRARADDADRALLQHCHGPTLDVGCGPGRMAAELQGMGVHATGIDVSDEAVGMSRRRGVVALLADIFSPLPAEGLWRTVLLADGNIGIGGDPEALLLRASQVLDGAGRVVAELAPSFVQPGRHRVTVETDGVHSEPFWWAVVAPRTVPLLARRAGFGRCDLHRAGGRRFAVLHQRD